MGSFAEFEQEIILERRREGVAKTKAAGRYKGRVLTARRQSAEVIKLRTQGPEQMLRSICRHVSSLAALAVTKTVDQVFPR